MVYCCYAAAISKFFIPNLIYAVLVSLISFHTVKRGCCSPACSSEDGVLLYAIALV